MPSNKELKADIAQLAEELGLEDISTEGLNNDKLAALKSDLLAKKRDAAQSTQADTAEDTQTTHVKKTTSIGPSGGIYRVAKGKSISTRRFGILTEGDPITPSHVGDPESFARLCDRGYVVKG